MEHLILSYKGLGMVSGVADGGIDVSQPYFSMINNGDTTNFSE